MPGWDTADPVAALTAFRQTCHRFTASDKPVGATAALGTNADWQRVCSQLAAVETDDADTARVFIEENLHPLLVKDAATGPEGLFTGYYEPELRGSRTRQGAFQTPLYGRPRNLVTVDLGMFGDKYQKDHIAGRVAVGANGATLVPFYDRAAIDKGAILGDAPVLAWVDDAVEAFFLEIQGSGRVMLDDGTLLRLGYAVGNGRSYTAIGKTLGAAGDIPADQINAITIKDWLHDHPDEAPLMMENNENVVFFKVNTNAADGPIGAANVPLVPRTSLAVDRDSIPLGALVWLDAAGPDPDTRLQQLMLAADTGGAIRGSVRGDVFFGHGAEAMRAASLMKGHGSYWILVPRETASPRD